MEHNSKQLALALLAYAAQRELSTEQLCRSAGTSVDQLTGATTRISPELTGQLYREAIRLSTDPLFGLHFGESLQLPALGIVGEAIKTSATVGHALEVAAAILPALAPAFGIAITREPGKFTATFIPAESHWQETQAKVQTLDALLVVLIHELDGLLLKKVIPAEVSYWRPITAWAEYERVLRCRPNVTPGLTAVTFTDRYWDEKIITSNHQLQQVLLRDFVNAPTIANLGSMHARVRDYLMKNSYLGVAILETVAANFNLSVRTLQRRLKEENVSFEALTDEVRKVTAISYLRSGNYPIKEVSWMLGYNDLGNFTRSFKRWTGMTPSVFQHQR